MFLPPLPPGASLRLEVLGLRLSYLPRRCPVHAGEEYNSGTQVYMQRWRGGTMTIQEREDEIARLMDKLGE